MVIDEQTKVLQRNAKQALVLLRMNAFNCTWDVAVDIIDETQYIVNCFLAGERPDYKSVNDIISDYLGLSGIYSWIFIVDKDCDSNSVYLNS